MGNPFRQKERRATYENILQMYATRHKTFFTKDGTRHHGNSFAAAFWAGYDGAKIGIGNYADPRDKLSAGYVFYRAGQDIAAVERKTK